MGERRVGIGGTLLVVAAVVAAVLIFTALFVVGLVVLAALAAVALLRRLFGHRPARPEVGNGAVPRVIDVEPLERKP
ncbi:MAG: hypothetical protein ACYDBQ_08305 [Thermoplasmatota archaeon]